MLPPLAMSAELYRSVQTQCTEAPGSRIPVASPNYGFRRCSSMRLRGERCERPCSLRVRGGFHGALTPGTPGTLGPGVMPVSTGASPATTSSDQLHVHRAGVTSVPHASRPPQGATSASGSLSADQQSQHHQQRYGGNLLQPPGAGTRVRSLSLSLSTPRLSGRDRDKDAEIMAARTPPPLQDAPDDDLDSLRSYASAASTASCEHPFVAHNGTTFSGRRMRYVVHCSAHAGQVGDEYLTPTQRAQRQIKRLKHLLHQAKQDIEQKDSDIFRLTKEVVELRLYKASLNSPESPNSSEAITVRENADNTEDMKTPDSPTCTDFTDDAKNMHSSYADSGHFEDLNNSKDSVLQTCDKACLARLEFQEERRLIETYEKKLEELVREHADQTHELKQKHNDKIEELLHKLSDVNIRYCQLVPNYEQARERIQELERQLDEVNARLQEQQEKTEKQGQMYMQMYDKGVREQQKVAKMEQAMVLATPTPSRVSVSELLQQLQVTQTELDNIKDTEFTSEHSPQAQSLLSAKEAVSLWVLGARKAMYRRLVESKSAKNAMDPEITLQFLKSAIYYFLTDKENHQGHLKAIQSILGFSPTEISNINKARSS